MLAIALQALLVLLPCMLLVEVKGVKVMVEVVHCVKYFISSSGMILCIGQGGGREFESRSLKNSHFLGYCFADL